MAPFSKPRSHSREKGSLSRHRAHLARTGDQAAKHLRNMTAGRFTQRKQSVTIGETGPGDAEAQRRSYRGGRMKLITAVIKPFKLDEGEVRSAGIRRARHDGQ